MEAVYKYFLICCSWSWNMDYLGNLRAPPHRSSTAVVYLYVCRASDICIFVSVHTLHLCAELGSKQETCPSPSQHSPAIKRLIFLRHETMCRRLMGSYTSITYHSTMRRLHLYSFFLNTYIIGHLLELSTKYCDIFRERYFLWQLFVGHVLVSGYWTKLFRFCLRCKVPRSLSRPGQLWALRYTCRQYCYKYLCGGDNEALSSTRQTNNHLWNQFGSLPGTIMPGRLSICLSPG